MVWFGPLFSKYGLNNNNGAVCFPLHWIETHICVAKSSHCITQRPKINSILVSLFCGPELYLHLVIWLVVMKTLASLAAILLLPSDAKQFHDYSHEVISTMQFNEHMNISFSEIGNHST